MGITDETTKKMAKFTIFGNFGFFVIIYFKKKILKTRSFHRLLIIAVINRRGVISSCF